MQKAIVILVLCLTFVFQATVSFARGGEGPGPGPGGPGCWPVSPHSPHFRPHGDCVPSLAVECIRLIVGGMEYFYWEGMYYRWARDHYVVVAAPVGAVVTTIPSGARIVVLDGVPYYVINGVTYMYTPYGYQVVPQPIVVQVATQPVVVQQAAQPVVVTASNNNSSQTQQPARETALENVKQEATDNNTQNSFTVNIPNSRGTYTAVTLKRSGSGFIGPQGEYYPQFPSIEQLKVMYAK